MAAAPPIVDFSRGELTPKARGRKDLAIYNQGLEIARNYMPSLLGGITNRPGTWRIDDLTLDAIETPKLIPFANDSDNDEMLLMWQDSSGYINLRNYIYHTDAATKYIETGLTVQLLNPYPGTFGKTIKHTRINDNIYFAGVSIRPFTVNRSSTGVYTINWTAYAPPAFDANRFYVGGDVILGYAATANVEDTPNIGQTPPDATYWTVYSGATAPDFYVNAQLEATPAAEAPWYPRSVTSRMGRLIYGGSSKEPSSLWGSMTREYGMFVPGLNDNAAWKHTLTSDDLGAIHWLVSGNELVAGTDSGEYIIGGGALGITPTNIQVKSVTHNGSSPIQPVLLNDKIVFAQSDARQLKGFAYSDPIAGWQANHMNAASDHIFKHGISDMVLVRSPSTAILAIDEYGKMVRFGYNQDFGELSFFPWYNSELAGNSDDAPTVNQGFLAVASLPARGQEEDLIFTVNAYNDGSARAFLELFHWSDYINNTNPPITVAGPALTYGMFLESAAPSPVLTDATGAYLGGLSAYEGETIKITVDNASHPLRTVSAGIVRLEFGGNYAVVGYEYTPLGKTMDLGPMMRMKRVNQIGVRFLRTVGAKVGTTEENVETVIFRDGESYYDTAIPMYDGDKIVDNPGGFDRNVHIVFQTEDPLPQTILAIVAWMKGSDK